MRFLASLAEFDHELEKINAIISEIDRITALCEIAVSGEIGRHLNRYDPFGDEYFGECTRLFQLIARLDGYTPEINEKSDFLDELASPYIPSIYRYGNSGFLAEFFMAAGHILKVLDLRSGQSVLEYGAGDGQLSLALARMGCEVAAIDVEPRYLDIIETQAKAMGVHVSTKRARFGEGFDERKFDRILFFEAFHHALDHARIVDQIKPLLKPNGSVVFAGEPIVSAESPWHATVPFPWGPRLDGLSLRAMRTYGWCELGFQREYFIERLMRSGWIVSSHPFPAAERGSSFVAVLGSDKVEVGKQFLIEAVNADAGWHSGEGAIRWTKGNAIFPLDQSRSARRLRISLHNYLPVPRKVGLTAGSGLVTTEVPPAHDVDVHLDLPNNYTRLEIRCDPVVISAVAPKSRDTRSVGIAVATIQYE